MEYGINVCPKILLYGGNDEGKIVVFEKVRTEKKAVKRLVALAEENREMEIHF